MKHTCPEKNQDTPLNRKRFNPGEIGRNFTGQAGQAKEYENNTPPPMNRRPLLLEGNQINPLLRGVDVPIYPPAGGRSV